MLVVGETVVADPGFDTRLHYLAAREACLLRRTNKKRDIYHNAASYNFRTPEVTPVVNFEVGTVEMFFLQPTEY
jgi:hypothetical protein